MTNQTNTAAASEPKKRGGGRARRMARPPEGSAGADTPAKPDPAPAAKTRRPNKTTAIFALLTRADGATLAELIAATGWLPHTTRAALTGMRKRGHTIERFKRDEATCYRIVGGAQ